MQGLQKSLMTAVILSEISHIFCCVLPIVFSLLSLMAGLGLVSTMPQFFIDLHHMVHDYEVPMIIVSGIILFLGWGVYLYSKKIDCHDTGCGHGPCGPRKKNAHVILKIATLLFVMNVTIYTVIHRDAFGWNILNVDKTHPILAPHSDSGDGDHNHDHHGHSH